MAKYINTDLVIESNEHPGSLVKALEDAGLFLLDVSQKEEGTWQATLENNLDLETPKLSIQQLIQAVQCLDEETKRVWSGCLRRELDLGFGSDSNGFNSDWQIENEVLESISKSGLSLRITIYNNP